MPLRRVEALMSGFLSFLARVVAGGATGVMASLTPMNRLGLLRPSLRGRRCRRRVMSAGRRAPSGRNMRSDGVLIRSRDALGFAPSGAFSAGSLAARFDAFCVDVSGSR